MKRRAFLTFSALLAAWPARSAATAIYPGIATFSLRSFSRLDAIRVIQQLGVRHGSVKDVHLPLSASPSELVAGCRDFEDAGISIVSAGNISLRTEEEAEIERAFLYAKHAGIPTIVCAPTQSNLRVLERMARRHDIRVAIHNHGPEDLHFPAPSDALRHIQNMDSRMGLCVDVGHAARAGKDVPAEIEAAGDRVFDVHLKDLSTLKENRQVVAGEGVLPLKDCLVALHKIGYSGIAALEYSIDADAPQNLLRRSLEHIRELLSQISTEAILLPTSRSPMPIATA